LVAPVGGEVKNPITFSWQGALGSGQAYMLAAVHSESGTVVQSEPLSEASWTTDLPADKFGEWRWRAAVISGGVEVATSDWVTFIFNPLPGVGPGGPGGPPATNTPPAP
jgi:hypothetical protein